MTKSLGLHHKMYNLTLLNTSSQFSHTQLVDECLCYGERTRRQFTMTLKQHEPQKPPRVLDNDSCSGTELELTKQQSYVQLGQETAADRMHCVHTWRRHHNSTENRSTIEVLVKSQ